MSSLTVDDVRDVVVETLGLTGESADLGPDTALLGALPELDSLAVMELLVALENRFGITFDDEDVSAEVFATVGTLTRFVEDRKTS